MNATKREIEREREREREKITQNRKVRYVASNESVKARFSGVIAKKSRRFSDLKYEFALGTAHPTLILSRSVADGYDETLAPRHRESRGLRVLHR